MSTIRLALFLVNSLLVSTVCSTTDTINFLVQGDWGGAPTGTTLWQKKTAVGMGNVASTIASSFVVALGDNFYFSGIEGDENSERFEKTWKDVYTASSLQTPWYIIAGNHDYKGNVSAQVEHTHIDPLWQFPSIYHSKKFTSDDGSVTLDLILLDTVDLCGVSDIIDESHPDYFKSLPLKDPTSPQWQWLEQQLASSTADYILVGGHFPIYSVCEHGPDTTLVTYLLPLLKQYNAHYMSGHDHCLEHFIEPDSTVNIFLSGIGDTCCYKADNVDHPLIPAGATQWYVSLTNNKRNVVGGFNSFSLSSVSMSVNYHDQDGNVLYTTPAILPRTSITV